MRKNPFIGFFLVLAMALGITTMGLAGLYHYWQFEGKVERVTGTVEYLHSRTGRHSTNQATYSYTDRTGVVHRVQSQQVAATTVRILKKGGPVAVKYLPEAPGTSRIDLPNEDEWEWGQARNLSLLGGFLLAISLFILFTLHRQKVR